MREILSGQKLPPDLGVHGADRKYVRRKECFERRRGRAVAVYAETARAYGFRVDKKSRRTVRHSKVDAGRGKFLKALIIDFGAGSSVMLALAAYNVGPRRVRQAVRRIDDPIKQRSFWYFYRMRGAPSRDPAVCPQDPRRDDHWP